MNQLVSTEWLGKNLEKVKILDASWHLPNANRNSYDEYKAEHIINSIFFDIDKYSNQTSSTYIFPLNALYENRSAVVEVTKSTSRDIAGKEE